MSTATIRIEGLDALKSKLAGLSDKIERRYVYVATAAAAGTIKDAVIARAPEWHGEVSKGHPPPGTLKRAISIGRTKGLGGGRVGYYVFVKSGKKEAAKKKGSDAYYWKWVEFGHYAVGTHGFKKRSTSRGRSAEEESRTANGTARWIAPDPFMRSAFDAQWQNAVARFRDKLRDQLEPDGLK
jgi:HK97 gp10 family phage protein